MGIEFEDAVPKTTIQYEDDVPNLPVPESAKKETSLLEKGTEIARQGLIGGIGGSVFPEFAQRTGQAIKMGGRAMGPYGRIPTAVGSAIEAGGVAMKASRPAAMGTGVVGGITGETAGQVVETANGPMIVNTRTGDATPIMAGGQPIAPKLTAEQSKDITGINQQRSVVDSALNLVEKTPSAFSFGRGAAGALPLGETLAGRTEKPDETKARAAVFNIVSKVINERAGAAQSVQELKRLNAFLPSEYDNAKQIKNKLSEL
jgi:hypothetical protein